MSLNEYPILTPKEIAHLKADFAKVITAVDDDAQYYDDIYPVLSDFVQLHAAQMLQEILTLRLALRRYDPAAVDLCTVWI